MASSLSNADPSRSATLQTGSRDKAQRMAGVRLKLFVGEAAIGIGQIDLLDCIGQTGRDLIAPKDGVDPIPPYLFKSPTT